jgi:hypothetical protein
LRRPFQDHRDCPEELEPSIRLNLSQLLAAARLEKAGDNPEIDGLLRT